MFYRFSNNMSESSNDFIILIILISSFKVNKVNPFPALTAPFPLILLSNLFIAFDPGKLSLAKGITLS